MLKHGAIVAAGCLLGTAATGQPPAPPESPESPESLISTVPPAPPTPPQDASAARDRHRLGDYPITQPGVPTDVYRDALRQYGGRLKDEYRQAARDQAPFLPDLMRPGQDTAWRVTVPHTYRPDEPHGVLVFIHAGPSGQVMPPIREQLAERQLIAIGADHAGNNQDLVFRHAAAVHAVSLIQERYAVDDDRIYVHGVSGGGRMSSRVIFLHGDLFDGAICLIGVDPYKQIPAKRGPNTVYRGFWQRTDRRVLNHVKQNNRIALLTGEHDGNRHGTIRVYEAYKKERFKHLLYLEEPGLGHRVPSKPYLSRALDFLDAPLFENLDQAYEDAQAAQAKGDRGKARRLYVRVSKYGPNADWVDDARAKAHTLETTYQEERVAIDVLFTNPNTPRGELSQAVLTFRKAWGRDDPHAAGWREKLKNPTQPLP